MLNRYRLYARDQPLQSWLFKIGILTALNLMLIAIFYTSSHESLKPGMILVSVSLVLGFPTISFMQRFSPEVLRENPVSSQQENAVGRACVVLALCSICSLILPSIGRQFGIVTFIDNDMTLVPMMICTFSALLSLAFGYAVRHTSWGRLALTLWFGGFALLMLAMPIIHLVKARFGVPGG